MNYVIGIDLGTSALKAVLFQEDGKAICTASQEYEWLQNKEGYAEQDPQEWWGACKNCIQSILMQSNVSPQNIKGVGVSGQMHGLVMLDVHGNVIRNAILWCDGRTNKEAQEIEQRITRDRLIKESGNPALEAFTAAKILWVKHHEPAAYQQCRHILLPKDYINYRLTNIFRSDVSDASGTQLFNVKQRCWSPFLLDELDICADFLPDVKESSDIIGHICKKAAQELGLSMDTVVIAGAGDNAAAAVGCGIVKDKASFITIGTSGVVYSHTDDYKENLDGQLHSFCSAVPGCWHVMGVTQAAGLSLRWCRDVFCEKEIQDAKINGVSAYVLMDQRAKQADIGANHLLFLPYLMGERTPHFDMSCKGAFIGLTSRHTKDDMIRSVMEGVAYSLKDCMEVMKKEGVVSDHVVLCGGGAKSFIWPQILADICCNEVCLLQDTEAPAKGVAILTLCALGYYANVKEACEQMVKRSSEFHPNQENSHYYEEMYTMYHSLYEQLTPIYRRLQEIRR